MVSFPGDSQSSLADLNTEHPFVIQELSRWVRWIVDEFEFDAIRIDTVKHVRKEFWNEFAKASGVFSIGEVLHGE
jgi:alpha-amylase